MARIPSMILVLFAVLGCISIGCISAEGPMDSMAGSGMGQPSAPPQEDNSPEPVSPSDGDNHDHSPSPSDMPEVTFSSFYNSVLNFVNHILEFFGLKVSSKTK